MLVTHRGHLIHGYTQVGATSQLVADQEQRRLQLQGEREAASLRAGYEVGVIIITHIITFSVIFCDI